MKTTQAAEKWLRVARRFMLAAAYNAMVQEAVKVAKERKATRLGRVHFEIALETLAHEPT